ncbi:Alpha/Beta hydrolase protein [Trichoderma ceciliae]
MKAAILTAITAVLLPIVAAIPAPSAAAKDATNPVTVVLPSGTIIGTAGDIVDTFNGIPYAEPPIGDLRFKPPVRLSTELGTFDATGVAASCSLGPIISLSNLSDVTAATSAALIHKSTSGAISPMFTEDCLTISVQRPHGFDAGAGLPVLFWIYGGGFVAGSTSGFDGTGLVETGVLHNQPFIFVAVNYRLGAWGFLPGKAILDEGSGNAGLLDQRMGLEWVADNIEAFGGDPDKVTIWGQSAGAISVFDQMVLYDGDATYNDKPLFRGAIMNSGSATPTYPLDARKGQNVYDTVVEAAGCDGDDDSLECLRSLNNDDFSLAANSVPGIISYQSLALSYLPRPDGNALSDSPDVLARKGKFHHVPMIIGTQEDEGTLFSLFQKDMSTTAKIVKYLSDYYFETATEVQITEFVDTYSPFVWDGSPYRTFLSFETYPGKKRLASILGDIVINLIRRVSLQTFAEVSPELPTWSYFSSYNYDPIFGALGTSHGSDLAVLFSGSNGKHPAITGRTYYINFLYNLDPNIGTRSDLFWPEWGVNKQLLQFNANNNSLLDDTYRNSSYTYMINHADSLRF